MARREKQQPQSTASQLAAATAREYTDKHTLRIQSARRVVEFRLKEVENEIVGLRAATSAAQLSVAELKAKLQGLDDVLSRRRATNL